MSERGASTDIDSKKHGFTPLMFGLRLHTETGKMSCELTNRSQQLLAFQRPIDSLLRLS